jgi:hypothetical protein
VGTGNQALLGRFSGRLAVKASELVVIQVKGASRGKRDDAGPMLMTSLKHVLVGMLLFVVGLVIVNGNSQFVAASEPVELIVLQFESEIDAEGRVLRRPIFGLVTEARPRPWYRGGVWTNIPVHKLGEVVPGRYDAKSGKMQSDRMLMLMGWIARLAQLLGVIAIVQGFLIRMGVPESRLLLPVRIGRSDRDRHRYPFALK